MEQERRIEVRDSMRGGKGKIYIEHLLEAEQLHGMCRMYAKMTVGPGCSVGYHEHSGESETYYILSGSGIYNDNQTLRPVKAGDVTVTPSGCGHALENDGITDLVVMALIINDQPK